MKKQKQKQTGPVCPYDFQSCNGFDSLKQSADCEICPRFAHGVRMTGAMPLLGAMFSGLSEFFKRWRAKK